MALFHTTVLDNQIKALPTVDTASGSIATFDTDMTENLVEVKCQIVATQSGSGTPSPSNPRPITVYTSLNLSHSGADTSNPTVYNIPFGQTVAQGLLNVGTGKLRVTHGIKVFDGTENWNKHGSIASWFYVDNQIDGFMNSTMDDFQICNMGEQTKYDYVTTLTNGHFAYGSANKRFVFKNTDYTETSDFKTWLSNNNMQVAYRLPSDLIIQLDSITLQALLNENNIWCDTGDTEVKFLQTVGKKIS